MVDFHLSLEVMPASGTPILAGGLTHTPLGTSD